MHKIPDGTGNVIRNTNHKRDHSLSIDQILQETSGYFSDQLSALDYLNQLREAYPRYIRDQAQVVLRSVRSGNKETADKSLTFCLKNQVFNANEFEQIYHVIASENGTQASAPQSIQLLDSKSLEKARETPQKSNLEDYETIFNS